VYVSGYVRQDGTYVAPYIRREPVTYAAPASGLDHLSYVDQSRMNPPASGFLLNQYMQQGFEEGRARAQNAQIARLSAQAYGETGAMQQATISQVIGINPEAGYALARAIQQAAPGG
ncbi:MAG: hypothetical protein ACREP1_07595, partial [Rhodanobacteraceae bacterium]